MIFYEGHKVYMNGEYPAIFLNGKSQHVHRLEWIKHNGEIPKGFIIHHKDENKLNWSVENLELLSRCEHIKKHKNIIKRHGIKVLATKDGLTREFDTIEEAAEFCGTYTALIQRVLKGKQRQTKGWIFERG